MALYAANIGQVFYGVINKIKTSQHPHTCLSCERRGSYNSATATLFNHLFRCLLVAQESGLGIHGEHALKILSGHLNWKDIIIFIVVEELNKESCWRGAYTRISDQLDFHVSYECDNPINSSMNSYNVKATALSGLFHETFNHPAGFTSTESSETPGKNVRVFHPCWVI